MYLNWKKPQGCIFFFLCLFFVLSGGCFRALTKVIQEEWQIQVGDSQTYMYTDFFEISSNDPSEFNYWIIDENNNNVTIILKKGLTLRYDITFLSPDEARGKITYNGTITSQEQSISSRNYSGRMGIVVRHSINNRTHWEEYCEYQAFENVTGDLIVSEINTEYSTHIYKWNWKTGWLDYYYFEYWNETAIKSVREISLVHKESLFPFNVLVGGFILGIIILFLLGIKKFK